MSLRLLLTLSISDYVTRGWLEELLRTRKGAMRVNFHGSHADAEYFGGFAVQFEIRSDPRRQPLYTAVDHGRTTGSKFRR